MRTSVNFTEIFVINRQLKFPSPGKILPRISLKFDKLAIVDFTESRYFDVLPRFLPRSQLLKSR